MIKRQAGTPAFLYLSPEQITRFLPKPSSSCCGADALFRLIKRVVLLQSSISGNTLYHQLVFDTLANNILRFIAFI